MITEGAQFDGDCKMPRTASSSSQSESYEAKERGESKEMELSFFVTQAQKAELRERGYSDDDIAQMKPADAHNILGLHGSSVEPPGSTARR